MCEDGRLNLSVVPLVFIVSFAGFYNDVAVGDFIDQTIGIVDSSAVFAIPISEFLGFS